MKGLKLLVSLILALSFFTIGLHAQELPTDFTGIKASADVERDRRADDGTVKEVPAPSSLTAIASTGSGGLWSSPSTWAGGVVPGPGDDVTISAGSVVIIDTVVNISNLTVGPNVGFNPGILTFHPSLVRALRVTGNVTISGLGILTTPDSGALAHQEITVGGNLTNNGVLDLSTNNNQAGADLIFTGASNNTFGGGGSQTNIRTITINKGTTNVNTLTLSVLNFTVQGSSSDGPASGYLTLTNGTFKISGSFSGNHRTFTTANYTIPTTAGFWLNNPNYTVTAQESVAVVEGQLRVSAGVYSVGVTANNSMLRNGDFGGMITVEGGTVNIAGGMLRSGFPGASYTQSGGTITTCMAGNPGECFNMAGNGTGGTLVVQTPHSVPDDNAPDFNGGIPGIGGTPATTLQFGNANTPGTGVFVCICGNAPNIAINTASGPHTVKLVGSGAIVRNVNIGAGATLDIGDTLFYTSGESFVNNGTFKVKPTSVINFANPMVQTFPAMTYSGSGSFSGPITRLYIRGPASVTFDPAVNSIRTRDLQLENSQIINAGKLTVGMNDALPSTVSIRGPGGLDASPVYDLGTGGQKLIYEVAGNRATGGEINPSRELIELTHEFSADTITIAGGDVTLNGPLNLFSGVIDTGTNKLNHFSGEATRSQVPAGGYIKGTLVHRFNPGGPAYFFLVGDNHYAPVLVTPTGMTASPAFVAVKAIDATLSGLPPATSASFSWSIQQTGSMSSYLELYYDDVDVNGPENYLAWRSTNHLPMLARLAGVASINMVRTPDQTNITGTWGVGADPGPISISGTVMASNGVGIRNAVVTVSGGTLQLPITFVTGTFGTYQFQNLDPGGEYTVFVSAKRNRFTPPSQIVSSFSSVSNVNFTANPPE